MCSVFGNRYDYKYWKITICDIAPYVNTPFELEPNGTKIRRPDLWSILNQLELKASKLEKKLIKTNLGIHHKTSDTTDWLMVWNRVHCLTIVGTPRLKQYLCKLKQYSHNLTGIVRFTFTLNIKNWFPQRSKVCFSLKLKTFQAS